MMMTKGAFCQGYGTRDCSSLATNSRSYRTQTFAMFVPAKFRFGDQNSLLFLAHFSEHHQSDVFFFFFFFISAVHGVELMRALLANAWQRDGSGHFGGVAFWQCPGWLSGHSSFIFTTVDCLDGSHQSH